ncbi:MAG: DUF1501 domain-containing protein [Ilumatobacteraceae bacterium]
MIRSDPTTAEARRLLHSAERTDAAALDRRRFLQMVGMGMGAGMLAGPGASLLDGVLGGHDPTAWAAGPVGPTDGILVVICMFGGNDGLNTVVPLNDGNYYQQHGALAVPGQSTLALTADAGLHPDLTELKRIWDAGHLAVVQGVGYPNPDLSHFTSMAYWMSGVPAGVTPTGWLGRWLDGYLGGQHELYAAAEIGSSLPKHLRGALQSDTVVPVERPDFGTGWEIADQRFYRSMRRFHDGGAAPLRAAVTQAFDEQLDLASALQPHYPAPPSAGSLPERLDVAARLINANLGFRVVTASWGDFDSHAKQPDLHPFRMQELNEGVRRFFERLDPAWASRVTLMTFSEFGRTSWSNAGAGTDHGAAAPHFVIGPNVRGGMYGQAPRLAGLGRWDRIAHDIDFRSYYASIIDGWLGGGSTAVLGGNFEDLRLFARGPGLLADGSIAPGPSTVSPAATFVPMAPLRVLDTRYGTGATSTSPLPPDGHVRVQIAGVGNIPAAGVVAVVANVTAVDCTQPNFFTVYPGQTIRPGTSNINAGPGRPVPNLVVMGVGVDGSIEVYNSHGNAHCIVDVFGYFTAGGGERFVPLSPSRLFDSRTGQGIAAGKMRHESPVDIQVAGFAGVPPSGATAVVMNLTVTEPESPGFARIAPAGEPTPTTSNVNFFAGDTVPNLTICKLGPGGRLTLDTVGTGAHVIGDVFGYFAGSGQQLRTVPPRRLMDTRDGFGAPKSPLTPGSTIRLPVAGRAAIPTNATAVVLNVAATNVAGPSFVTVWPSGEGQPDTSNLNVAAGQTVANLVMCRLGTDGDLLFASPVSSCDVIADVLGYFTD